MDMVMIMLSKENNTCRKHAAMIGENIKRQMMKAWNGAFPNKKIVTKEYNFSSMR